MRNERHCSNFFTIASINCKWFFFNNISNVVNIHSIFDVMISDLLHWSMIYVIKSLISEDVSFSPFGHILASAKAITDSINHNLAKHVRHVRGFLVWKENVPSHLQFALSTITTNFSLMKFHDILSKKKKNLHNIYHKYLHIQFKIVYYVSSYYSNLLDVNF